MPIGEDLARQFEETNERIIRAVEGASDEQWRRTAPEGWPAGVTLHHIAVSLEPVAEMVRTIATGGELPAFTSDMLNEGNAQHAVQAANDTQAETAAILRDSGKKVAEMLRSLSDKQYGQDAAMPLMGGQRMTARQVAEGVVVGHGAGHLEGVQKAFDAQPAG